MVTELALNATEICLSSHHSVAVQSPFSQQSEDWNVKFPPLIVLYQVTRNKLILQDPTCTSYYKETGKDSIHLHIYNECKREFPYIERDKKL